MLLTKKQEDNEGLITFTQLSIPEDYFVQDPEVYTPERHIYDIQEIKLTEDKGALVYIGGATHPHKTIPAGQIVGQMNILKEYLKQSFRNLVFIYGKDRFISDFIDFFKKCFYPYRVKLKYMCPTARGVNYILYDILTSLKVPHDKAITFSFYIAHVFEFDDAYRYRLQDIATAIDIYLLLKNPRKEILRVLSVSMDRELHKGVVVKLKPIYNLVTLLLLIPKYRDSFTHAVVKHIDYLRFDAGDIYWAGFKDTYNYCGVTHEEHKKNNAIPDMYVIE